MVLGIAHIANLGVRIPFLETGTTNLVKLASLGLALSGSLADPFLRTDAAA
jgi:hypothetical protein